MKFRAIAVFIVAASLAAFGQGRGGGGGRGQGGGMGQGAGMGQGPGYGQGTMQRDQVRLQDQTCTRDQKRIHQGPLNDSAKQSRSWNMLQQRTGMDSAQLERLYAENRVRNYGQFGQAMIAARNANLDSGKVLGAMKEGKSVEQALREQGMTKEQARLEIKNAQREMYKADATSTPAPK